MNSKKLTFKSAIRKLPFILVTLLILGYLTHSDTITFQTIVDYSPENPLGAILVLLLLYGIKSILIVVPILILEIAGGILFPTFPAIIINSIGIIIGHGISYWIGYISGSNMIPKLTEKYPAFKNILQKQNTNSFFSCFFLRTLFFLPGDVISMYLGASKIPFFLYLIASTLGTLPSTILATLFGSNISEPSSPMFWISIVLMTLFAGNSLLIYHHYKRKSTTVMG